MKTKSTLFIVTLLVLALFTTLSCQTINTYLDEEHQDGYDNYDDGESDYNAAAEEAPQAPAPQMEAAACPAVLSSILAAATTPVDSSEDQGDSPYGEDGQVLVTYQISGDRILNPQHESVTGELQSYQDDAAAHQEIWDYYAALIPSGERSLMTAFIIMTDGQDNSLAAVAQDPADPYSWSLEIDIIDSEDLYNLTYTLIHEYGHLLTLNKDQVEPDLNVFADPEDDAAYDAAEAACPNYFPGEGCADSDSYINSFFGRFWDDIYDEWFDINLEEDDDVYYEKLDDFYYKYEDNFVTDYAVTNPEEDIAESWTFFVLQPKPTGNTTADQKILFFYEYPDLVSLREHIRTNICSQLAQP
ncbi:MAG: hypothetical protein JXA13_15575 [Anaerolineales bacterium]|nr:hypothetical protein [Anaerolineales bacterium]